MIMTATETQFILWSLISLIGVLAYIGKLGVAHLGSISKSVNRMEKDLSVLANDHTNLKEEVKGVRKRVERLEAV